MNKTIFVIGAYGCGNRGDDAILQSITEQFSNYKIYATCGRYEDIGKVLPVEAIPCRMNEGISISVITSMLKDYVKMIKKIISCDFLFFGGGSLIHDLNIFNLPFMFSLHFIAILFHKKVFYFNIGVGPIESKLGKMLVKKFFKRASGVYVRDKRGMDICKELNIDNVKLTCDAAFLTIEKNPCNNKILKEIGLLKDDYICVTASQWFKSTNFWKKDKIDFSNDIEKLAKYIILLYKKTNKKIVFVPTVYHDYILAEKLFPLLNQGKCDYQIIPKEYNCMEMAEIIENSYLLFGIRMHSIIFAARQCVPFMCLIYDEKVNQLLEFLKMENYSAKLFPENDNIIEKIIDDLLKDYSKIKAHLQEIKKKNYILAHCSVDEIIKKIKSKD
ncbi:MAG: polysaccharide pyruvyl transferase CsaB [Clostridiaceae bacterium]|jgi:polysaccharide pyruvyl transferase WcaK-like protein|nr:polysaccharide pyruvyl transferase CsaB [Clostridiaceae bacterium]